MCIDQNWASCFSYILLLQVCNIFLAVKYLIYHFYRYYHLWMCLSKSVPVHLDCGSSLSEWMLSIGLAQKAFRFTNCHLLEMNGRYHCSNQLRSSLQIFYVLATQFHGFSSSRLEMELLLVLFTNLTQSNFSYPDIFLLWYYCFKDLFLKKLTYQIVAFGLYNGIPFRNQNCRSVTDQDSASSLCPPEKADVNLLSGSEMLFDIYSSPLSEFHHYERVHQRISDQVHLLPCCISY